MDLIGGLHTEGAILNMLASQLKAYTEETSKEGKGQHLLSNEELSRLTTLGEYVIDNLDANLTIQELSLIFGLSPKKMQIGVKHLYGNTVGQYILNLRMGHAQHLFQTTEFNVSEVCRQIGISSQSYFSKIFKDRYGTSPSVYRSQL